MRRLNVAGRALALLALGWTTVAMGFDKGDRVLAEWEKGLWYPGRVQEATDGGYRIA